MRLRYSIDSSWRTYEIKGWTNWRSLQVWCWWVLSSPCILICVYYFLHTGCLTYWDVFLSPVWVSELQNQEINKVGSCEGFSSQLNLHTSACVFTWSSFCLHPQSLSSQGHQLCWIRFQHNVLMFITSLKALPLKMDTYWILFNTV